MQKLFPSLLLLLCWGYMAQAQYYVLSYSDVGRNPGGLNTDAELAVGAGLAAGWTTIHNGSAATPQWTAQQTMPFPFLFNGETEVFYQVSTSGVLTFSVGGASVPPYANEALPAAVIPDKSICVWGLKGSTANDKIVKKVFGDFPNRQLWIMFNGYEYDGGVPICNLYWSIVLEETTHNIYIVDQRGSLISTCQAGLTLGVQVDAETAVMVPGSPSINNSAGTNSAPDDNSYYAIIPGQQPRNDLEAVMIDLPETLPLADAPVQIKGTFLNMGSASLRSFDLYYAIDGDTSVVQHYAGQIASLDLTHNTPWMPTVPGTYQVDMWVSMPNGEADAIPANNSMRKTVRVVGKYPDRLGLIESFTQWNCGPCAAQNPALEALLSANKTKATAVKFVGWWPGANNDERHLFNVADNTARIDYYGVNGVPTTMFAGTWEGQPGGVTQAMIDAEAQRPGLFDIQISESLANDSLFYTISATALGNIGASALKLYVAITQDERHYTFAPGSNGERDFYHTMRYMLPNAAGTALNGTSGQTVTVAGGRPIEPRFYKSFMNVVVWVEDDATKEVYMSTKSTGIYLCSNGTPFQPTFAISEASCGNSDGAIDLDVAGTGQFSYVWSSGETTQDLAGKAKGIYHVTVTDTSGCSFKSYVEIKEKPAPNVVLAAIPATCKDAADGRVKAYVAGGAAPYTYSWTGGGASEEIDNLPPGFYALTLTDANGCQTVVSAVITEPTTLGATTVMTHSDNGTTIGSAFVEATGGTFPYTYSWNTSPVQTGDSVTGLAYGTYEVTVRDYYGCEVVQTVEIANTTGIDDLGRGISALSVVPNPSTGRFNLSFSLEQPQDARIDIMDAAGRIVFSQQVRMTGSYQRDIDLGSAPAGIYTLRLLTSQGVGLRRLVVE
ncbi:MAG: hypothetical protein OHK0039_33220 [Bacteroidia bacterium]